MKKLSPIILLVGLLISCNNPTSNNPGAVDTLAQVKESKDKSSIDKKQNLNPNAADNSRSESAISASQSSESLSSILKKLDKTPQSFYIASNQDTIIICGEGTSLKFKGNTFVSETTGKEVIGRIKISVKEYYKLADMLIANLSTTSEKNILETGGMINLTATFNNENCILKKGNTVEIGFPYKRKKENMKIFNGNWTNNKVDWTVNNSSNIVPNISPQQVFSLVENMPEFKGGEKALFKYLDDNCPYPFSALDKNIEGTVYVSFVIDEFGEITNVAVKRGVNSILDKAAYWLVSNMPDWNPGRQNGKSIAVTFNLPISFKLKGKQITPERIAESKLFEKKIENINTAYGIANNFDFKMKFENRTNDTNLVSKPLGIINRYLFSTSQLGWINCDRFYPNNTPRIDYVIDAGESSENHASLVFHSMKAILDGYSTDTKFRFFRIPAGEKVTIVVIKKVNNEILLAVKESTTDVKGETNLTFETVTITKLKSEMEKLNTLN